MLDPMFDAYPGLMGGGPLVAPMPQFRRTGYVAGRPAVYGAVSNPDWLMHQQSLIEPPMQGSGDSNDLSGGGGGNPADTLTAAGAPVVPAPTHSDGGSMFLAKNGDLLASLGGALLGGPTLRQGLGAFGAVAPQIMARDRSRNATIDYLTQHAGSPAAQAYMSSPAMQKMLLANPEMANALAQMQFTPHPVEALAPGARLYDKVTGQFVDGGAANTRGDGSAYDLEQAAKAYEAKFGTAANRDANAPDEEWWYKNGWPSFGQGGAGPERGESEAEARRGVLIATAISKNYIGLPIYNLVANGGPYLSRIDVAAKQTGSAADVELVDSAIKLATGGGQITEAQVKGLTGGSSAWDQLDVASKYVKNGGFLSDNQKQQIKTLAHHVYEEYQKQYQPVYDQAMSEMETAGVKKKYRGVLPDLNELSRRSHVPGGNGRAPAPGDNGLPVEPDTGDTPLVAPPRPPTVPEGSAYSPSRDMWQSPDGHLFNAQGGLVQ